MRKGISLIIIGILSNTILAQITDTGNLVGIGTTNPASKLDVRTSTNKGVRLNFNDESAITFVPNNGNSIFHLSHGHDNRLHISEGGTVGGGKLMTFVNSGNIGIGTTNPASKLDVRTSTNKGVRLNFNDESAITFVPNNGNSIFHLSHGHDNRLHISQGGTVGGGKLMTFVNSGNIGIGTSNPDMKLTVKGNIHAEEVKIDLNVPAPDYVFKENYNLRSIAELEKFIIENSHLPEIPSAKEFEQNGVMQAEMDMNLLKKIEELTLYTIQQQKQIEKLESLVEQLIESKK